MDISADNMWWMGFVFGFVHVVTGPDHLAAVAPLVVHKRKGALAAGLRWGVGHCGGILLVGGLMVAAKNFIPVELLSSYSERLVGVVLIALGIWGWRKAMGLEIHTHEHHHDGSDHAHIHLHTPGHEHGSETAHGAHTHTALAVGILHGFAGSSHILGVIPALAMPTMTETVLWLVTFAVGTILGMVGFSALLGHLSGFFASRGQGALRGLLQGVSVLTVGIGCWWLTL